MPAFDPVTDYPLAGRRPDLVRTPAGKRLGDVTLEALRSGALDPADMRATPDTLRRQAEVARAHGRGQLAESLERAAELTTVPDDVILEIYRTVYSNVIKPDKVAELLILRPDMPR